MRLAGTCHNCGANVVARTMRPAVFICRGCGGTAEALNTNETANAQAQARRTYTASDGTTVRLRPDGNDGICEGEGCVLAYRSCHHVAEVSAWLRSGGQP